MIHNDIAKLRMSFVYILIVLCPSNYLTFYLKFHRSNSLDLDPVIQTHLIE
jgi:hypothetical protein